MSLYTFDKVTGGDASRDFFVDGPVMSDPVPAMIALLNGHCVLTKFVPDYAFLHGWIINIERQGQLRIREWDIRPHISIYREDIRWIGAFRRCAFKGGSSTVTAGLTGDADSIAFLANLWLRDIHAFAVEAKKLLTQKKVTMRSCYQYSYRTPVESIDIVVENAYQNPITDYPCFLFHDLKD